MNCAKLNLHVNDAECDPAPGNYYVSIFDRAANNGRGRLGLLLGPYPTHREALDRVADGRVLAERVNDRAVWYAVGTVRMSDDYRTPGVLNNLLSVGRACPDRTPRRAKRGAWPRHAEKEG